MTACSPTLPVLKFGYKSQPPVHAGGCGYVGRALWAASGLFLNLSAIFAEHSIEIYRIVGPACAGSEFLENQAAALIIKDMMDA